MSKGLKRVVIMAVCFLFLVTSLFIFKDRIIDAVLDNAVKTRMAAHDLKLEDGLHAFLIGTGSPLPDIKRAGPCIAIMAGDRLFVVDAGEAAARNIMLTGLSIGKVEAVLLTHFHSDHISGLGEMMLQRWAGGSNDKPLEVIGPEGVEEVVAGFNMAFKLDDGYRTAMHGEKTFPPSGAGGVAKPFALGPEDDASMVILDQNGLKITAFRVDHKPVVPAVGYKFEYKGRSLLISGDTKYCLSLEKQAVGVDLLLHEAMNPKLVGLMHKYSYLSHGVSTAKVTHDLVVYHSSPEDVAKIAQMAKVPNVVLYHIIPPLPSAIFKGIFLGDAPKYYDGSMTIGEDGMMISLPVGSKSIRTKYLFR
jgi:ribonuclease Z